LLNLSLNLKLMLILGTDVDMGMEDIGLDMVMQGPITPMSLTAR